MMELINYYIVKIIPRKILLPQILLFSQSSHRRKYDTLVSLLVFPIEKPIVLRIPDIPKRYCSLLQNLFPMCHKQDMLILCRVKCRKIGLSYSCRRLHQSLNSPFRPAVLQRIQCLYLRPSGLKQRLHLRVRIVLKVVILFQILCYSWFMPAFRIALQLCIVYDN